MSFIVNPYWYASAACPDADANAFLTAAGITDPTISGAICTLVTSLKAQGIWAKMDAIYPFVGGTATTHKFNLKNPADTNGAFRLSFVGGWTHSATGATPNGTNGYANTFLAPLTHLSQFDHSISMYLRSNLTNSGIDMGCELNATASLYQQSRFTDGRYYGVSLNYQSSRFISVLNATANQMYTLSRTSNALLRVYKNTSILGSNTLSNPGTLQSINLFLGAVNSNGRPSFYSNRELAFASIGDGLSNTEATNLYNTIQTFQTTLGRQV
jgi:hypothetical protein